MWDWLVDSDFMPHGYCLAWDPKLVALHAVSDLLILGAYTAIPIAILIFLRKWPQQELKSLARFFAAFIFWCGLTHLMGLITLWYPLYDLQGVVKAVTALISVSAAVVTFWLIPKALAIPSPRDLQRANEKLRAEALAHQQTLQALQTAKADLESKVRERTEALEKAAAHATLLMREIAHRSGNLMAVITAMARQSLRHSTSGTDFVKDLVSRIEGLGRSHDLLVNDRSETVDLKELIGVQLKPFLDGKPVVLAGPPVAVGREAAQSLGMIFHELARAMLEAKAPPGAEPRLTVSWWMSKAAEEQVSQLELEWMERRDPLAKPRPLDGWSRLVLEDLANRNWQATSSLFIDADRLVWRLQASLSAGLLHAFPPPTNPNHDPDAEMQVGLP